MMSIRATFTLLASLGLSAGAARCDHPSEHRPEGPPIPSPAEAMSAGGAPIDRLGEADETRTARRVRLLGLTQPAKDTPHLRLLNTSLPLSGDVDHALWRHHDRLVIVEGVLTWEPVREVSTVDEHGNQLQMRNRAGGFGVSRITASRRPTLAELAGRRGWVEGEATAGSSIRTPEGLVRVEGRGVFPDAWRGHSIRADGAIEQRGGEFVIVADASYPVDLARRLDADVELAGRCWSMNDAWWFSFHGLRIGVEAASDLWPPRHLPGGGHGELARITGRLVAVVEGSSGKYVMKPRIVLPLGEKEILDASW